MGTKGKIHTTGHNMWFQLLPADQFRGVQCDRPESVENSRGAEQDWFAAIRDGIAAWLAANDVVCVIPETLPSDLYADDSHPLTDGYEQLAKDICRKAAFQEWLAK